MFFSTGPLVNYQRPEGMWYHCPTKDGALASSRWEIYVAPWKSVGSLPSSAEKSQFCSALTKTCTSKTASSKGYHQQPVTFGLDNYLQMTSSRHILQLYRHNIYSSKSLRYSKDTRQPRIARTTTASNQAPMAQMKNHEKHQQNWKPGYLWNRLD